MMRKVTEGDAVRRKMYRHCKEKYLLRWPKYDLENDDCFLIRVDPNSTDYVYMNLGVIFKSFIQVEQKHLKLMKFVWKVLKFTPNIFLQYKIFEDFV